ncbi:MAG: Glutamate 5-kinase 1 [Elusimicrobia bacterium ADurb.Bin231]|nr:MAG: Glutamate 5-kinase 1 [Elusimicrobia bacterium ADurb.Bin231]
MKNSQNRIYKRVVIKIGSGFITGQTSDSGTCALNRLVEEIYSFIRARNEAIIVSSGAIALGATKIGLKKRPVDLPGKQASAAIGQVDLMKMWERLCAKHGGIVAQILLTKHDFYDREKYLNARNTILKLLSLGVVPVINENDTVATEEINFGDNDTLSAVVASKVGADALIIFTDVDGFYNGDPRKNRDAVIMREVREITNEMKRAATSSAGCSLSIGGMASKLSAAKIAMASGVDMFIVNGKKYSCLSSILGGSVKCTKFISEQKMEGKKRWIAFGARVSGKILVDAGAARAIGKMSTSLLPSGVLLAEGGFHRGDIVSVFCADTEIAKGMVFYSCEDINKIKGHKSSEIHKLLCRRDYDEIIHKDNLVILS